MVEAQLVAPGILFDRDHVDPPIGIFQSVFLQVAHSESRQSAALRGSDRFLRCHGPRTARSHFHEYHAVAILRDDIQLAETRAKIALQDAVTRSQKVGYRVGLPGSAQPPAAIQGVVHPRLPGDSAPSASSNSESASTQKRVAPGSPSSAQISATGK